MEKKTGTGGGLTTAQAIVIAGIIIGASIVINKIPMNFKSVKPTSQEEVQGAQVKITPLTEEDHIRGASKDKAEVFIVEFSDTECPYCKEFHTELKKVIADYGDKVAWVYRHFPLQSKHPKAFKEAEATECAGEQGKFWEFLDKVFEITPSNNGLDEALLPQIANGLDLDMDKFNSCLDSEKYKDKIEASIKDAIGAGAKGTPFSIIVPRKGEIFTIPGAATAEQIKTAIDTMLKVSQL